MVAPGRSSHFGSSHQSPAAWTYSLFNLLLGLFGKSNFEESAGAEVLSLLSVDARGTVETALLGAAVLLRLLLVEAV